MLYNEVCVYPTAEEAEIEIEDSELITKPFFRMGGPDLSFLYDADQLDTFPSEDNRTYFLAKGIPARSFAVASNAVFGLDRDKDMFLQFKNNWPASRTGDDGQHWKHNDFRDVAYLYVYKVFETFVNIGGLE